MGESGKRGLEQIWHGLVDRAIIGCNHQLYSNYMNEKVIGGQSYGGSSPP